MFLQACISKLLSEWGCGPLAKDDYVHEICRYGGAELHSVSSFTGKHLTARLSISNVSPKRCITKERLKEHVHI
jgi:hypothetical protein